MPEIITLDRARADLVEIWDYIADDSETQADLFIDTVDRKLRLLAAKPHLGRSRPELAENMRSFPLGRYVIFYVVMPDGIQVVRVLHGARDLGAIFEDESLISPNDPPE
jgi:toxin ParE1/3/4